MDSGVNKVGVIVIMNKQLNFFVVENDEREFLKMVAEDGAHIIDVKGEILLVEDIVNNTNRIQKISKCYFVFPQSHVVIKENGFVSDLESEVIEFSRSIMHEKKVERGRIYVKLDFYEKNKNLCKKPEWLSNKFDTYSKWIRKNTKKSTNNTFSLYIGKKTFELYTLGYEMVVSPKTNAMFQ